MVLLQYLQHVVFRSGLRRETDASERLPAKLHALCASVNGFTGEMRNNHGTDGPGRAGWDRPFAGQGLSTPRLVHSTWSSAWINGMTGTTPAGVERFETESWALLPGQRVKARVLSHHPWGVIAEIVGHEHVGASVDMIEQFGRVAASDDELLAMYPPIGARVDAVVQQVQRWHPPAWVRLSIRPADLESFTWPCGFCGRPTTLSPGGDGLVLDVRSNDGPGSHTVISHRTCLADRIHPQDTGERARALQIGKRDT